MKLVHLIPALKPGGPVQALKTVLDHLTDWKHHILTLDPVARGSDLIALGQKGAQIVRGPSSETVNAAVNEADVVLVHFYNHPRLLQLLAGPVPDARWVVWFKVGGQDRPQRFLPERMNEGVRCAFTLHSKSGRLAEADYLPSMVQQSFLTLEPVAHTGIVVDYIGSTNPAKLHRDTIKRLDAVDHPNVRFRFHGGPLDQSLQADLEAARHPESFEIGAFATDVAGLLATSDIFVTPMAPNSYASSDLALQEAMHAGVAPVIWGASGPALMITDGVDGRVVETGEAFTQAVQALCDDADLRARLGNGAKSTAKRDFDPVTNAGRMDQLLREQARTGKS